jgi:protein-L-isoaspartate(D-aspartate) O-methyltransferase
VRRSTSEARERMVADQLIARGISDPRVLAAFRKVPRQLFIPPDRRGDAYGDHPAPIGLGQTISQPYMVAVMTEKLALTGVETVLEVGTGSGYQAAILAELAARVYSVERIPALAGAARRALEEQGYHNVLVRVGDGTLGWPEYAPFDRILVTAGGPEIPPPLLAQLAEGGLLLAPVGGESMQQLTLVKREAGGSFSVTPLEHCVFVKLIGRHGWQAEGA